MDSAEFLLGTVTAVSQENGLRIRLDGQDAAMSKYYKMLNTGADAPGTGDRVVVMKHSGTYIVMGRIGTPNQNSGKVSRSGDTMTGPLILKGSLHCMDSPEITLGSRPDANKWSKAIAFRDSVQKSIARLQAFHGSNGWAGLQIYGDQQVNGETQSNYLGLYMTDDGTPYVSMNYPAAWRRALGLGSATGALPLTAAQGGTGAATAAANRVLAGPSSGDAAAPSFRALAAADLPIVPISKGGTGNTGVVSTTTIDNIITAGSEFTVTGAQYCAWGKIAMIFLTVSVNSETTSSAWHIVGNLQSGKRPACPVYTNELNNNEGSLLTNGDLRVWGKFASGKALEFSSIYLLA